MKTTNPCSQDPIRLTWCFTKYSAKRKNLTKPNKTKTKKNTRPLLNSKAHRPKNADKASSKGLPKRKIKTRKMWAKNKSRENPDPETTSKCNRPTSKSSEVLPAKSSTMNMRKKPKGDLLQRHSSTSSSNYTKKSSQKNNKNNLRLSNNSIELRAKTSKQSCTKSKNSYTSEFRKRNLQNQNTPKMTLTPIQITSLTISVCITTLSSYKRSRILALKDNGAKIAQLRKIPLTSKVEMRNLIQSWFLVSKKSVSLKNAENKKKDKETPRSRPLSSCMMVLTIQWIRAKMPIMIHNKISTSMILSMNEL